MEIVPTCYLTPKAEGRALASQGARGIFATQPIRRGELIAIWGGEVVTGEEVSRLSRRRARLAIQVEENHCLLTMRGAQ